MNKKKSTNVANDDDENVFSFYVHRYHFCCCKVLEKPEFLTIISLGNISKLVSLAEKSHTLLNREHFDSIHSFIMMMMMIMIKSYVVVNR